MTSVDWRAVAAKKLAEQREVYDGALDRALDRIAALEAENAALEAENAALRVLLGEVRDTWAKLDDIDVFIDPERGAEWHAARNGMDYLMSDHRAPLAASSAEPSTVTTRTITIRCHCGRGVTIGPDPWCEGCVQSAATCDCVPATQGRGDA